MSVYRSSSEIQTDLAAFRAARAALIKGERLEDVWRDGRRMRFSRLDLTDMNRAIADLERELEAALAGEAGQPRRRPIGLAWKN